MKKAGMRKRLGAWAEVLLGDPCAYCGGFEGPTTVIDHITPKCRGGKETWENATAACSFCNGSKGRRSLLAFLGYEASGLPGMIERALDERTFWNGVGA